MTDNKKSKNAKLAGAIMIVTVVLTVILIWVSMSGTSRHNRVMEQHAEQLVMEINKIGIALRQDLDMTAMSNVHLTEMVENLKAIRKVWEGLDDKIKKIDGGQ